MCGCQKSRARCGLCIYGLAHKWRKTLKKKWADFNLRLHVNSFCGLDLFIHNKFGDSWTWIFDREVLVIALLFLFFLFFYRIKVDFCISWALLRHEKAWEQNFWVSSEENSGKLGKILGNWEKFWENLQSGTESFNFSPLFDRFGAF